QICFVYQWLIFAGLVNRTSQIVRHYCIGNASVISQGIFIAPNPIPFPLAFECFHVTKLAASQDGNEYFDFLLQSGFTARYRKFLARKINEHLVSRFMLDVHPDFLPATP